MTGAIPLRDYLAWLRAAKPGDPRGGFLEGQPDQLQKLPGSGQGHGGEFVVNAEATKAYRPLLEAMNRSVPPAEGVKAERPSRGRAYYGGGDSAGSEGAGPAGASASGDDAGVSADTATSPAVGTGTGTADDPFGMPPMTVTDAALGGTTASDTPGDPNAEGNPTGTSLGMAVSDAHGHPDAMSAALTAALSSVLGALTPGPPSIAGTVAGLAGMATPLGPALGVVANAAVAAANAQNAAMSAMTGLTPDETSNAMAAANTAAADAAAGTGLGPGGQGGADSDEPGWRSGWRPGEPPVALSAYLAWLRATTTAPVRGIRAALERSPAMTPWGTGALPVYHAGGVVKPAAGTRGLREALILAEPGEYVVQREPAKKYRRLLDAINADDPTRIRTHATLREAMTR